MNNQSPKKQNVVLYLAFVVGLVLVLLAIFWPKEDQNRQKLETPETLSEKVVEDAPTIDEEPVIEETPTEVVVESPVKNAEEELPKLRRPKTPPPQVLEYDEAKNQYAIKVPRYQNAVSYTIEIYSDSELKKRVEKIDSESEIFLWETMRSGKYYYRYRVKDKWGRVTRYSVPGELIFPISPMVEL